MARLITPRACRREVGRWESAAVWGLGWWGMDALLGVVKRMMGNPGIQAGGMGAASKNVGKMAENAEFETISLHKKFIKP